MRFSPHKPKETRLRWVGWGQLGGAMVLWNVKCRGVLHLSILVGQGGTGWMGCSDNMSRLMSKPTKWLCSQRIRSAWASAQSDQSLRCAKDPSFLHAGGEDSDQTGRMSRLIWVFAGRTIILLVLSRGGSYVFCPVYPFLVYRTSFFSPILSPILGRRLDVTAVLWNGL